MFGSFLNVFLNSIVMLLYYQYYCSFSFIYFVILSFPCFIILDLIALSEFFLCYYLASFLMLSYFATYFGQFFLYVISFLSYPFIRVALFKIVDTHILEYVLSQSYIKRLIWYNLYDSQLAFKFLWRLHDHTICSYQVHKSCSYRLFILQELKQNDLKISCSSSKSRKKRKKKEKT